MTENTDRAAALTAALHAEADDLEHRAGMVSPHWVAAGLRFIAEHARRWPRAGEGVHVSTSRPTQPASDTREHLAAAVVEKADVWRSSGETADGHLRAEAALIAAVDAYRRAPAGVYVSSPTPAAAYDWERYKRTCDPDRQLDGLGDLCLFLGGSWSDTPGGASFTGELLKLIVKAQSTPDRLAALDAAFPRETRAWRAWMASSPIPTAAELCATLTEDDNRRRVLLDVAKWPAARVLNNADIWGPEQSGPAKEFYGATTHPDPDPVEPVEPTLEEEYAGRMDAADRAAREEDRAARGTEQTP